MGTVLLEAATLLAVELATGTLALGVAFRWVARTRNGSRWRLAAAESLRAVIPSVVFIVAGVLLVRGSSASIARLAPPSVRSALLVAAGSVAAAGVWLLLEAGRYEARGKLDESRFLARVGGLWLAGAAPAEAAAAVWILVAAHAPAGLAAAAVLAALGAALAGLLAGLSGKPRPTGWAAGVLAAGAVFLLAFALWRSGAAPPGLPHPLPGAGSDVAAVLVSAATTRSAARAPCAHLGGASG